MLQPWLPRSKEEVICVSLEAYENHGYASRAQDAVFVFTVVFMHFAILLSSKSTDVLADRPHYHLSSEVIDAFADKK